VCIGSTWRLIDLDTSCPLVSPFGAKLPSTGYCPPEMAKVIRMATDSTSGSVDTTRLSEYKASIAYDLWSYGVLLFHLLTGRPLWHADQNDKITRRDLKMLSEWTPAVLNEKLFDADHTRASQRQAIDLLRKLLEADPVRRIALFEVGHEMRSVLRHEWFAGAAVSEVADEPLGTLFFVCSPTVSPLPNAAPEAYEVAGLCTGTTKVQLGGTADALRTLLAKPPRRFLFSGHADAQSPSPGTLNKTLGFTQPSGNLEIVQPEQIRMMLALAGPRHGGCLELVFLNGCCSEALGLAVHAAGVPTVVCWRTKVCDPAARVFARAFFKGLEDGRSVVDAFEDAKNAVMCVTHSGQLTGLPAGMTTSVPKFELREPGTPSAMTFVSPIPIAAGVPVLVV